MPSLIVCAVLLILPALSSAETNQDLAREVATMLEPGSQPDVFATVVSRVEQTFSVEELRQVLAFGRTEAGRKLLAFRSHAHRSTNVPPRVTPPGFERVGGDVRPPNLINRVEPVYPDEARAAGVTGMVSVEMLIDATGRIVDAIVLKGPGHGLDEAALEAVRQWTFEPATKNGVAVPVVFNLTINFKLH